MNHYDLETDDMKLTLGSNRHNTLMEKTYPRVSPTDVPVMRCFFFRCNKRRNTVILRWSDLKNPGFPCILVASKLVDFGGKKKHLGVSNKPSLKKTFWLKDWVQIWYHQRSIKKPRVKRWWPRKRRWIPRPCLGSGIFFWWVFGVSTYAFLAVRNLPKLFLN